MLIPIATCRQFASGPTCPFGCKSCAAVEGTALPAGCYTANTVVNCMDRADGAIYAGDGACPKALPGTAATLLPSAYPTLKPSEMPTLSPSLTPAQIAGGATASPTFKPSATPTLAPTCVLRDCIACAR